MSSAFSIVERGGVKLIRADCIARLEGWHAYFSTGFGGVSDMPGGCTMNLAMFKRCENDTFDNVRENFRRFADACGVPLERISLHREVHEPNIAVVTRADLPGDFFDRSLYGEADGQVTSDADVALFVYAADCCTILLVDPRSGVSGATHCGWRNSANGTIASLLRAFEAQGGSPESSVAVIGPAISARHYAVDAPTADRFRMLGFADFLGEINADGFVPIDLPGINRRQLEALGVPAAHIHTAPWCTWEGSDLRLPSYRRDHGRNAMLGGILFRERDRAGTHPTYL